MPVNAPDLLAGYQPALDLLSKINNSFVYVGECRKDTEPRLLYVSSSFNKIFDCTSDDLIWDPGFLLNRIHPEDKELADMASRKYLQLLSSTPQNESMHYKIIYEVRIMRQDKEYIRVIVQEQTLEFTPEGLPWIVLGIADPAPNQSVSETLRLRLLDTRNGEFIPLALSPGENSLLTTREKEILQLIGEGRLSKEISETLSISLHTVNRHRQNILQKFQVDNSIEAIRQARKLGLIEG